MSWGFVLSQFYLLGGQAQAGVRAAGCAYSLQLLYMLEALSGLGMLASLAFGR